MIFYLKKVAHPYGHRFLYSYCNGTNTKIGAHSDRETPVPIPNTAVKPISGYNTWVIKPWENSTVPIYIEGDPLRGLFLYKYVVSALVKGEHARPVRL